MSSFASELGVQFDACMEAPHVIDVESQLWASVITSGPGNCQLNASYKTADAYDFQDSLGASLEEICKTVPGGALIFFPSYKLLEKLRLRWCQTGQWSRLNAQKTLFVEPRGSTDDFESVLGGYYDSIHGKGRVVCSKTRNGQKRLPKRPSTKDSPECSGGGAAFLAVCRGKVSEGIDFTDDNARVVVIVGIPFPNINDTQVVLKKRYNDTHRSSKNLLSGSEWYCHQAFRALNQAAGRCIRHRFDYGAIILLDERYKQRGNLNYISKWLRNSIKQYDGFDESMKGLRNFFEEKRLSQKGHENESLFPESEKVNLLNSEDNLYIEFAQSENQKPKKNNPRGRKKIAPDNTVRVKATRQVKSGPPPSASKAQHLQKANDTNDKSLNKYTKYIDLENTSIISRCSSSISALFHKSAQNRSMVSECTLEKFQDSIQGGIIKEDSSLFKGDQNGCETTDGPSFSCCTTLSNGISNEDTCITVSPERVICLDLSDTERESLLNKSVNSYHQRKRKVADANYRSCAKVNSASFSKAEKFDQVDCIGNGNITRYTSQRTGTNILNCSSFKPQKPTPKILVEKNKNITPTPSDILAEKKLHLCCLSCKRPLGLLENNFLVLCSPKTLSKSYLAYVLKHGPGSYSLSECLRETPRSDINVLLSDFSSIDPLMFGKDTKGHVPFNDIWCEEDGCVFRAVFCPFCSDVDTCLGVEIKATDAWNVDLLNKVVFFADRLHIKTEQTPVQEPELPVCANNEIQGPSMVEIEKFTYNSQLNHSAFVSRTKSKLRLPKKEE